MGTTNSRRRAFAGIAAACALGLALAGCGGGETSGAAGGPTKLVWNMWSGSTAETENWTHLADMVTAKYPDITIEFQTTGFNDYWTKLVAQASGGETACILGVQSLRAPTISSLLVPLDQEKLQAAGINLADFDPSIVKGLQVDGEQLGVPYDFGPLVMYYNVEAFQAAGLPAPKIGWTTDDFMTAARTLTKDGKYGFSLYPSIDNVTPWSLSASGTHPVVDGKLNLTQPGFEQATQWYVDLVSKEKVAAPVQATSEGTPALDKFISGESAMTVDGPWQLINTAKKTKFTVGVAPMPAGASGSHSQVAGSGFGVSTYCDQPEAALKAISVITGPEALQYLAEQGRAYPARTAQQEKWFRPELAGARDGLQEAIKNGVFSPTTAKYTQVAQLFRQHGVAAVNGQTPVPEFLDLVQQQAG
ncbi:ABC transporter substrate-binding protein [Pseudonocardia sp. TRM90224]|uniref:ABC transporter substrate-binding protein n=1 Tax=Pseudonocardia sp. TRM90224 TaxID=2812678 RepID=UPI001E64E387|nr:sugar ABC transporter substrate-binding protein [Pseudonocardia sp. TRM90224]